MRNLNLLDIHRDASPEVISHFGSPGDDKGGMFRVPSKIDKALMTVIASNAEGWDHVSISRTNRCPNWIEMEQIKRLFFHDDEIAMQLHMPVNDHISLHPYCLHIWRPHKLEIPLPPADMVA